jgi:colanic acid/amylovoran biosynthesis glycosyltransferase
MDGQPLPHRRSSGDPALPSLAAVVSRFPAPSQTFIRRKLEGLRAAGMDVTVASTTFHDGADQSGFRLRCTAPWQHPRELLSERGREDWREVLRGVGRSSSPSSLRRNVVAAPIAALDTDVVHFEFSGIAVTYLDALDDLRRHTRLAVSCRGAAEQIEPLRDPSRAGALAAVFSRMDLIHCVSEDMRRTVEQLGAPADRIVVNRPAVPVSDFLALRPYVPVDEPLRVLSIGRLHWKKGLDDGLRAVADLRSRGVECTYRIAGDGPEREKLTFMVEALGLSDSAELLGTCSEARVREELQRADVVLLPSLSEGISNVVLEAMAAGRAVITTDCGGMTEVVHDEDDGLLVRVGDVAAMSERLAALAEDAGLRRRLGESAAATADAHFDISRQVRVFLDAYRSITS